ncbi:MAG TPA: helix-turn-helix transcriptional regulator [Chloroflexota bacterium]|nr:helix-turn-helix transcriptional regulator [Chloroflexota bacterium]
MPESYTDWMYMALRKVGLTQHGIETQLGIAKGELSRILRRHRPASVERVQQLVDLLSAEARRKGLTLAPFPPPHAERGRSSIPVLPESGEKVTSGGQLGESQAPYDVPLGSLHAAGGTTSSPDSESGPAAPPDRAGPPTRHRWYRTYQYGAIGDPTDAQRAPRHHVERLVKYDEAAMIGEAGWAVTLTGNELSNWSAGGGPLGPGWALYCNPELAHDVPREAWEGQLVIARDLAGRLLAGVLSRAGDGNAWLLSTDSASLRQQVVNRVAQVYGPVVLYQPPSHLTAQRMPRTGDWGLRTED